MDLIILDGGEGANLQTFDTLPDYNADLETRKEIRKNFHKTIHTEFRQNECGVSRTFSERIQYTEGIRYTEVNKVGM